MAAKMNAATFMGKIFSTFQNFIMNSRDLTLKQMFDVTAQLVINQDEINGLDKIQWEKDSWRQLSLIGDETVIHLQRTKVYVFSDSVLCLGKIHQHPESNEAWKNRIEGVMTEKRYRDFDGINGEPTEFEWNIFPGFTTLQLCGKVNDLLSDLGEAPELSQEEFYSCQCSTTSPVTEKAIKKNVWQMPESSKYLQRNLVLDNGHLLAQVLKRSGILEKRIVHKELGIISRLEFAESGHPIFRATTPLSRCILRSKGHGKLSIHFTTDYPTIETVFRIIISANQLSINGAVAAICEEFEAHQDRSGEPDVLMGQSVVLGEIEAEIPLQNENPSHHQILWQQYMERIESLLPESKLSKFCMDAGFLHVVEVGQYFMTKDTGDFRNFRAVTCREYTLHRDDQSSQPKGWIQGNTRIGPVLEVTTSCQYGKHGIEIRIWSVAQDNSQSWVRISYGTNKYVVDSNHNNTEIPANPHEEQASQTSVKVIAARSKEKAKPQKREPIDVPNIIPMHERKWIDI